MISRPFIQIALLICCIGSTYNLDGQPSSNGDIFAIFSSAAEIDTNSLRILFLCRSGERLENKRVSRQFLQEDWQEGGVLDYTNAIYPVRARYRVIDDEMLILSGEDVCVLQRPSVQAIRIDDRIFACVEYFNRRDEIEYGYFELLTEGRIRLLRHFCLEGNHVKEKLYLQIDGEPAVKYKGRRNALLPFMNDQQQSMKEFLEQGSFHWNDTQDLIIIIDQYHRLRSGT